MTIMITAKLRHLRISPRKVRLVTDLIKGMKVAEAEKQLAFLTKKAARPVLKLLDSAVANATNNFNLTRENLYIDKIVVEPGPGLKRWMPRAMGRATPIMKRTSHITLVLRQLAQEAVVPKTKEEAKELEPKEKPKKDISELARESQPVAEEPAPVAKPKAVPPPRPYPTTPRAKKRFFSRQTFGNVKKFFRRKSI